MRDNGSPKLKCQAFDVRLGIKGKKGTTVTRNPKWKNEENTRVVVKFKFKKRQICAKHQLRLSHRTKFGFNCRFYDLT